MAYSMMKDLDAFLPVLMMEISKLIKIIPQTNVKIVTLDASLVQAQVIPIVLGIVLLVTLGIPLIKDAITNAPIHHQ